jgi:cell division protein FtsL
MMMALPNRVQYMNTAPNPEIIRDKRRAQEEETRRLEKSRQEFAKKNAIRNNKMRMSAILTIFFMATGLFITIFRSGMIYNMQNEYVQLQSETRTTLKNNEALQAEIIKASSIGEIAQKSLELELVSVDKESRIVADLSKNNFIVDEPLVGRPKFADRIFSMLNLNIFN